MNAKIIFKTVKWVFSIAILIALIFFVDINSLIAQLRTFSFWTLLIFLLLIVMSVFISSLKWTILLQHLSKKKHSMKRAFILYAKSSFYSKFLPASFGGDIYKVARIKDVSLKKRIGSIFLDRASGAIGLCIVFMLTAPLAAYHLNMIPFHISLALTIFAMLGIVIGIVFYPLIQEHIFKIRQLERFRGYSVGRGELFFILSLSLLFFAVGNLLPVSLIFNALGIKANIIVFTCFISLIYISAAIPFTINGIGIMESVYVYLFSMIGFDSMAVLTAALSVRVFSYSSFLLIYLPLHFASDKIH